MFRIILVSVIVAASAVGCKSVVNQKTTIVAPDAPPLRGASRVYVAMPEDALDKKELVPGSGKRTALAIQDAFKRHTKNVLTGRTPETLEEALSHARQLSYEYVAIPTILKWQDRPTEWTGVRDKLQLKIEVFSVETSAVIYNVMIDAKGKWMTDGEETPQDLLAEPIDKFVRGLFRATYMPSALQHP